VFILGVFILVATCVAIGSTIYQIVEANSTNLWEFDTDYCDDAVAPTDATTGNATTLGA
jgi:hypothetical protein